MSLTREKQLQMQAREKAREAGPRTLEQGLNDRDYTLVQRKIQYVEGFDGAPGPPPAVPTISQRMSCISGQCADVVYRLEGLLGRVRPMDKRNENIPIDGASLTDSALYTENALEDCRRLLSALEETL